MPFEIIMLKQDGLRIVAKVYSISAKCRCNTLTSLYYILAIDNVLFAIWKFLFIVSCVLLWKKYIFRLYKIEWPLSIILVITTLYSIAVSAYKMIRFQVEVSFSS